MLKTRQQSGHIRILEIKASCYISSKPIVVITRNEHQKKNINFQAHKKRTQQSRTTFGEIGTTVVNHIVNGMQTKCRQTKCLTDKMPNRQNAKQTKCQTDKMHATSHMQNTLDIIAKYPVDANLFRLGSTSPKINIQPLDFH